jgi:hypothetical protein
LPYERPRPDSGGQLRPCRWPSDGHGASARPRRRVGAPEGACQIICRNVMVGVLWEGEQGPGGARRRTGALGFRGHDPHGRPWPAESWRNRPTSGTCRSPVARPTSRWDGRPPPDGMVRRGGWTFVSRPALDTFGRIAGAGECADAWLCICLHFVSVRESVIRSMAGLRETATRNYAWIGNSLVRKGEE